MDLTTTISHSNPTQKPPTHHHKPHNHQPLPTMTSLTTLPGEIRNLIYSYALSYDSPLTILTQGPNFHTYHHDPTTNTHKRVVENLPLVCKQLHRETLGLVYRYNDIAFTSPFRAMRTCSWFLWRAPKNVQDRLRKVIVVEKRPQDARRMYESIGALLTGRTHRGVYDFCKTHPRVSVVVRMDGDAAPGWVASAMVGSVDVSTLMGMFDLVRVVGLGLALRDEHAVTEMAQELANGDFVQLFREYVESMLWSDADRSKVLQNYRATPMASFVGEMDDELWVLAKMMFERGC